MSAAPAKPFRKTIRFIDRLSCRVFAVFVRNPVFVRARLHSMRKKLAITNVPFNGYHMVVTAPGFGPHLRSSRHCVIPNPVRFLNGVRNLLFPGFLDSSSAKRRVFGMTNAHFSAAVP
jgi:hypothetical protein